MKQFPVLLPLVALGINLAVYWWLGNREETVRGRGQRLAEALANLPAVNQGASADEEDDSDPALLPDPAALPDLEVVAREMAEEDRPRGDPDGRVLKKLEYVLFTAGDSELLRLMSEVVSAEISAEARVELLNRIAVRLVNRLDATGLETAVRLYGRLKGDALAQLQGAYSDLHNLVHRWAKTDPAAVGRWIDEQKEAGFFVSRRLVSGNRFLTEMEAMAIAGMISSDLSSVHERLDARSESDRKEIFSSNRAPDDSKSWRAWAEAMRQYLPEASRQSAWEAIVSRAISGKALARVDLLMNEVSASDAERRDIVVLAAGMEIHRLSSEPNGSLENPPGGLTLENVAGLRTWLAERLPEEAEEALGRALADGERRSQDLSRFIERLHAAEPSDAMVLSYLIGRPRYGPGYGQNLAGLISDPEMRRRAMEKIGAVD